MKISTITCHDVYNYGASLQAYALQEYCKSLGCEYEIIDYKPDYLSQHFKLSAVANSRYDHPFVKQLYLLAKLPERIHALKKKRLFDEFTRRFLLMSPTRYNSYEELEQNPPAADIYIAGSDQIWNTFFRNGYDRAFYLNFAPKSSRRISYAASFATDSIYGGAEEFVAQQLKNLDAISVRETSALQLLESLGRKNGQLVCDPVFLLSTDKWLKLLANCPKPKKDYIVVYDCEQSVPLRKIVMQLSSITGLPIHSLATTAGHYAQRDLALGGPIVFLSEIASARYVVANSFHALAFSLIFKKDFFIANRAEQINTRMRDFLEFLGLSERLINSPQQASTERIDFTPVNAKLSQLIQQSKQFISEQLGYAQ